MIGLQNKFGLDRFPVYSGFGLIRFHCIYYGVHAVLTVYFRKIYKNYKMEYINNYYNNKNNNSANCNCL